MKKKKEKVPPKWSHAASPAVAVAMVELSKTKRQQEILAKRAKLLSSMIVDGGGGVAHGLQACITHQIAGASYRMVRRRDAYYVRLRPAPEMR